MSVIRSPDESKRPDQHSTMVADTKSSRRNPEAEALRRYSSADEFLRKNDFYMVDDKRRGVVDTNELTHTGLDLKRVSLPDDRASEFLHLLARDVFRGQSNFFCEVLNSRHAFRFFADFDIVSDQDLAPDFFLDYARTYQTKVMSQFYDGRYGVAVYLTHRTPMVKDGVRAWKYGMHLIWPDVTVKLWQAHYIHEMSLAVFKNAYPPPAPPSLSIDDMIDGHVYRDCGGLRLAGCEKMIKCPECKRREKMPVCQTCDRRTGLISVGRPYFPRYVMDEHGQVDAQKTALLVNNLTLAMQLSHIRLPAGTAERADFHKPVSAPEPPSLQYSNETLNKAMARILRRYQLLSPQKASASAAASSAVSKRVNLLAEHFGRVWLFENNQRALRNIKQKVMLRADDPCVPLLQEAIRKWNCKDGRTDHYHPQYKNIIIQRLVTNAKKSHFYVTVTGEGSFYCMNKRANHTHSSIYFFINGYGEISQKCMSPRHLIREEGVMCCDYSSMPWTLEPRVQDLLFFKPPRRNGLPHLTVEVNEQSARVKSVLKARLAEDSSPQKVEGLLKCATMLLESLVPLRAVCSAPTKQNARSRIMPPDSGRAAMDESEDASAEAMDESAPLSKNQLLKFGTRVLRGKRKRPCKPSKKKMTSRSAPLIDDARGSDEDEE